MDSLLSKGDVELVEESLENLLLKRILLPFLFRPLAKLDVFLEENRYLFTLIGVFAAVSIYQKTVENRIGGTTDVGKVVLFTGFMIVILLSFLLLTKMIQHAVREGSNLISYENLGLLFFASFFFPLVIALGKFVSQFSALLAIYYFIAIWYGGIIIAFFFVFLFTKIIELVEYTSNYRRTIALFFSSLTLTVVCFFVVATSGLVKPDIPSQVIDGGSITEWFSFASTSILTFLTLLSSAYTMILLVAIVVGGIIAVSSLLWKKISTYKEQ